jgi:glutamine amidotransferase
MTLGIINLETGNMGSIESAMLKLNIRYKLCKTLFDLDGIQKIILPGVGAFGDFMNKMKMTDMDKAVLKKSTEGIPILGVCVGFQVLFKQSTEQGKFEGLHILNGKIDSFSTVSKNLKIPHVGWNECNYVRTNPLFDQIKNSTDFYFTHSFFLKEFEKQDVVTETNYGLDFVSSVNKNNIYGVQFHPEKSQAAGLKVLNNFYELC